MPRVGVVAALTVVLTTLGASPSAVAADPGAGPATERTATSASTSTSQVQRVAVDWQGCVKVTKRIKKGKRKGQKVTRCSDRAPVQQQSAAIPGIGQLTLTCKPNATMVQLFTEQRDLETQMWTQKYEVKGGRNVVAVKNARIYRYAHRLDSGAGGTGPYAHEGLNQHPGVENYAKGYLRGVISQRAGRNNPGPALSAPRPVTTFELNWYWNGFDHPQKYRSCTIDAVITTQLDQRIGVTWHGESDGAAQGVQTTTIPGIGDFEVACRPDSEPTISLRPTTRAGNTAFVEYVGGEGAVEDHVNNGEFGGGVDDETGLLGPYPLPRNGMVRILYRVGGQQTWLLLSSLVITNNPNPELNLCEISAGRY